ncbi:hypothetical protein QVD17_28936 [Tagetes erecta]|uniref:Uncharacterized protein n=1 Tax=Tagetes erecta TaxID=13708 RepID=A0AAD8KBB2_TARER|nr:hypothetical protein QVD17_28936 [Tagetes erecta]
MANTATELIWITHLLQELHALPRFGGVWLSGSCERIRGEASDPFRHEVLLNGSELEMEMRSDGRRAREVKTETRFDGRRVAEDADQMTQKEEEHMDGRMMKETNRGFHL